MAGVNPYIAKVPTAKAARPFHVTFIDEKTGEKTDVAIDPAKFPFGQIGLDGSLLDIATEAGVQINHTCGGVCACSTCHVYIQEGLGSCSKATEDEEDQIDKAPALTTESRLSCQCVPNGTQNIVVLIPRWNRNQVEEAHH